MTDRMRAVDRLMQEGVDSRVFPGGVLIVSVGRSRVYHRAYGVSDLASGRVTEPDDLFDLASLTKPLATALAVLKLVGDGAVGTADAAGSHLPFFRAADKAGITLEQLLRHESGYPAHRPYYRAMMTVPPEERRTFLRQALVREPLETRPGDSQVYSDLGYMVLSWVVETVSGLRLDRFVTERVYRPLNVEGLFFMPLNEPPARPGPDLLKFAATEDCPWRGRVLRGEVHDDNAWAAGGVEGHAGLFGSAGAAWSLLREILSAIQGRGSDVIPTGLIRSFVTPGPGREKAAGFDTPSPSGSSSGRYFSPRSVGHLGFTGTSFWMDPDRDLIVLLFTNRVHPTRADGEKIRAFRPLLHDRVIETLGV